MPTYFHRPENALNRAREFIDVGKKESAVEVLSDVIRSKKHRQWSETHEGIMQLYLKLCTELQRSLSAKDGLYQYRNICKDTNLNSFKEVIEYFLDLAEGKASSAREESAQTVLDIEDLDAIQTPESVLLSTVSGEDTQDRTDRIMLMPWVKFLWESFRNVLELLKNNRQLEAIYVHVAKRAFAFCLEYKRRTEFHKLCDILRNHLSQIENAERQLAQDKQQANQYAQKLDSAETIQCLVDTRFEQLDKAIAIDLWQEAFKAIESINFLISRPKQKAKASLLENFYQKQASVYWMANNKLFHAAALHRLFVLRKEQKKTFSLGSEEAQKTATQVLLATLSVPITPILSPMEKLLIDDSTDHEKAQKLSALLRIPTPPTRASLLNDLAGLGVFQCVSQEINQLYQCLEFDFNPLSLCRKVKPLLESLSANEDTSVYVGSLREVTLVRFVKQISQVYHSIPLSRLAELSLIATPMELERIVVETARTNDIEVKIDHQSNSLWFGKDISLVHHDKIPEGPVIQSMPSEVFGRHLTLMAQALQQAASIVLSQDLEEEHKNKQAQLLKRFQENESTEHRAYLKRKQAIEDRKEFLENIQKKKEQQLREEEAKKEIELREQQKKILDEDMKKENEEKKRRNIEEMKRKMAEDKLETLKKTPLGARAFADVTAADMKDLDADEILLKQLQQMDKERRDKETKLKGQEKRFDYMERAKRMVEIPLLEKHYQSQIEEDKKFHDESEAQRISKAIEDHEKALKLQSRLQKMEDERLVFKKIVTDKRKEKLADELAVFEAEVAKEREARLAKRKEERKEKRKAEAERLRKEKEEREAREKEEREKKRKEEEDNDKAEKLEQQRQKQLQKEKEVEEKMRLKEEKEREERQAARDEERQTTEEGSRREDNWRRSETDNWRQNEPSPSMRRREPDERGRGAYRPPGARRELGRDDDWRDDKRGLSPRRDDRRGPSPTRSNWRDDRGGGGGEWRRGGGGDDYDRYGRRGDDRRDRDSYSRGGDRERDSERFRGDREPDRYRDRGDSDRYRGDREAGNEEGWEEVRSSSRPRKR
uniref:Eukaryotic translation initiation factor 3 subunit A n=1 Tax=Amphimedon queenslandica TaxID=400682 RepID=A0A1X7VGV1_AMPQE